MVLSVFVYFYITAVNKEVQVKDTELVSVWYLASSLPMDSTVNSVRHNGNMETTELYLLPVCELQYSPTLS